MADVSLDDYILNKGIGQGINRGFNGPAQGLGKVVVSNSGVRSRLGGSVGRVQITGPGRGSSAGTGRGTFQQRGRGGVAGRGRGQPFQRQTITFSNNNPVQQTGLTTKKFTGGLTTKKHIQPVQVPQTNVTVTGVGSFQNFDARQKLLTKKDARAKIIEKTKFSDARVRIQNSRLKKDPPVANRIKLNTNSKPKTMSPISFGIEKNGGLRNNGSGDHVMYGGPRPSSQGIQVTSGGGLTVTKPGSNSATMRGFPKTANIPEGYEDLFEDEPMSIGSECNTTMDYERGPVISIKNEHFSQQPRTKPTPITFSSKNEHFTQQPRTNPTPITFSPNPTTRPVVNRGSVAQSTPVVSPPLRLSCSNTVSFSQPDTDINMSRRFSAQSKAEAEEEMILNAPKPVLPQSRPHPKAQPPPPPPPPKPFGGPPLVLSRSRPKDQEPAGVTTGIGSIPNPLKLVRPDHRSRSAGSSGQEKLTLSARSPAFPEKAAEQPQGDSTTASGFRILVTNLHPIVTQDDIIELFGALGPLIKVKLVKPGTAEVVYVKKETAASAVKKYNNRELDGQPMQVKLLTPAVSTASKVSADIKALSKAARDSSGPPVDTGLIHKALFKTAGSVPATNPVSFTVQI